MLPLTLQYMAKQLAKHGITACVLQHFTTQKTTFDITAKYEKTMQRDAK